MYLPEFEILTSDIDEIISEKKLREVGSSGSSNTVTEIRLRLKYIEGSKSKIAA